MVWQYSDVGLQGGASFDFLLCWHLEGGGNGMYNTLHESVLCVLCVTV